MKHSICRHIVPRETFKGVEYLLNINRQFIDAYTERLFWWNGRINLISRDVSRETTQKHVRHSLLLHYFSTFKNANFIVDAGTGGGLPGIPLAIANQKKKFLLNDVVSKKVLAVKQIARELNLGNITTVNQSVEKLRLQKKCILISKHAFKLDELFNLTKDLPWTSMIFYKGMDFESEISSIQTPLNIDIYDLYHNSNDLFFKDKAIIEVAR